MVKIHFPSPSGGGHSSQKFSKQRQYRGVRMRSWGAWVSEIRAPSQKTRIWLGSYSSPEAAARAYDAAVVCLKGSTAALNFPRSSPLRPPAPLLSPKSIQRIAAAAAAAAPPQSPPSFSSSSSAAINDATTGSPVISADNADEEISSPTAAAESWTDDYGAFQSPKCFFDPTLDPFSMFASSNHQAEELAEIGDLTLWSFCS